MAPPRKSKTVNKRYVNEVSPVKDVNGTSKSKQKKKLSDKLGPQWSKGELQRFYEAYRHHGKDWKKVAAQVRNRSIEMVEALYNMNRAYLSLPEGTASVVGLIAMMTDHYSVLEESGSERESNDASGVPQKSHKRKRAKLRLSASKENNFVSWSTASSDGCLSFLKRARSDGSQPRAVKKRTPRVPVSYSSKKEDRDSHILLTRKERKSDVDANDDEVAHVVALALTQASQRGGSPQVSRSPYKRTEHGSSPPVQSWDKMFLQPEATDSKFHGASFYEDCSEGRIGSRKPENGISARDTNSLMNMEGVGTVEVHRKGKKFYRKRMKVEEVRNSLSDDGGEACSGTDEGMSTLKGKVDIVVSNAKNGLFSTRQRKKKKKLFFGDESSSLDALETLADLSLMFPDSTMESESSVQLKDKRTALDINDKSTAPEAASTSHLKDKIKLLGGKEKAPKTNTKIEGFVQRKSKLGRYADADVEAVAGAKEPKLLNNLWKRKRKPILSKKISNAETLIDSPLTIKSEVLPEEVSKLSIRAKHTSQVSTQSKQWKPGRVEGVSINADQKRARIDLAVDAQVPAASQVNLPTKRQSRRKMDPKRKLSSKVLKSSENTLKNKSSKYFISQQDGVPPLEENLSCCLSSEIVQRWCTFEWFYSAIDYPWFANMEFVEYLNHVGLGHISTLTRVEWGVIRSSLGKPRRLSERFLHDEREKLKQYRESVRKFYAELRTGLREGLPRDLPRPLSVGQRVIAIHPRTRELHDGSVLTVDHDKCRVQFDCPEIGVEFVMDIDCMPSNPFDNVPEVMRRQVSAADKLLSMSKEMQVNGHPNFFGSMTFASGGHLEKAPIPMNNSAKQAKGDTNRAIPLAKSVGPDIVSAQVAYGQPCTVAHIQEREADIRALSELNRALVKKEALLMELKNTNNHILESQSAVEGFLKDSEPLKKHIAMVLVLLKEANGQASSALLHVRQRNTHPENTLPPWLKSPANSSFLGGWTSSFDSSYVSQESGPAVVEIVKGSRLKAHTMVDAAIKAMSSMKEGEDAFIRIGEALDHIDKRQLTSDSRIQMTRSPEQVNGILGHQNQVVYGTSEPLPASYSSGPKLENGSDKNEARIPVELITSCVASLLMIQTCTERQYPPSDVAQMIDSAVSSLHPHCAQNLPIYREIEMCMGRIKTQILALIPT